MWRKKWRGFLILASCGFFVACWIVATKVQFRTFGERIRQEQIRREENRAPAD
jgi:hypothetical protein